MSLNTVVEKKQLMKYLRVLIMSIFSLVCKEESHRLKISNRKPENVTERKENNCLFFLQWPCKDKKWFLS